MGFDAEVESQQVKKTTQVWHPAEYGTETLDTTVRPFTYETLTSPGYWETQETGEEVTALKIKTADYVGGGNILGAKGGTAAGRQRQQNTKPKGGGGGKDKKKKDKDVTRYHEINAKLEQTSAELEKIAMLKDRAFGQDKLDAMDKEIELLQRQADQYQELYDEAKRYYDYDKKRLEEKYGATFNPDGTIANYDTWYKSFVDKYNNGNMTDDE